MAFERTNCYLLSTYLRISCKAFLDLQWFHLQFPNHHQCRYWYPNCLEPRCLISSYRILWPPFSLEIMMRLQHQGFLICKPCKWWINWYILQVQLNKAQHYFHWKQYHHRTGYAELLIKRNVIFWNVQPYSGPCL